MKVLSGQDGCTGAHQTCSNQSQLVSQRAVPSPSIRSAPAQRGRTPTRAGLSMVGQVTDVLLRKRVDEVDDLEVLSVVAKVSLTSRPLCSLPAAVSQSSIVRKAIPSLE